MTRIVASLVLLLCPLAVAQTVPPKVDMAFTLNRPERGEQSRSSALRPPAAAVGGGVGVLDAAPQLPAVGPDGWTAMGPGSLSPSSTSVIACVDWETGLDSNPGTMAAPFKTTAKGYSVLRDGEDDWLMIRNGRTTRELFPSWNKSGKDPMHPMVVCGYGQGERWVVLCGSAGGFEAGAFGSTVRHDLVLMDGWFQADAFNGSNSTAAGVEFLGSWSRVLLENVRIGAPQAGQRGGFFTNLVFQSDRTREVMTDIRVRRCVITDAYTTTSAHSEGCYLAGIDRLLLEECVFDHNGWNEAVAGAVPDIFRHNIYLQGHGGLPDDCTNVTTYGIVTMRAAATGFQQRPGGPCSFIVCVSNPMNAVYGNDGGTMSDLLVWGFRDIDAGNGRGVAYNPVNATANGSVRLVRCVAVGPGTGTANIYAFAPDQMPATIDAGVSWNWRNAAGQGSPVNPGAVPAPTVLPNCNLQRTAPAYPCTAGDYMAYLGFGASDRNDAGLAREARLQSRVNWRSQFSARAMVTWVQVAFGLATPVYANCDNSTVPPVVNKDDFTCFLQRYAAGDPWANCDGSTTPPVLNVADFTCFLQKYAAAAAGQGAGR